MQEYDWNISTTQAISGIHGNIGNMTITGSAVVTAAGDTVLNLIP